MIIDWRNSINVAFKELVEMLEFLVKKSILFHILYNDKWSKCECWQEYLDNIFYRHIYLCCVIAMSFPWIHATWKTLILWQKLCIMGDLIHTTLNTSMENQVGFNDTTEFFGCKVTKETNMLFCLVSNEVFKKDSKAVGTLRLFVRLVFVWKFYYYNSRKNHEPRRRVWYEYHEH